MSEVELNDMDDVARADDVARDVDVAGDDDVAGIISWGEYIVSNCSDDAIRNVEMWIVIIGSKCRDSCLNQPSRDMSEICCKYGKLKLVVGKYIWKEGLLGKFWG